MMKPARFVARPSLPKLALLLFGSLLFVAAGLWLAGFLGVSPRPGHEWIGWLSIAVFGSLAVIAVLRLFDRKDQIIMNEKGLYWRRWSDASIPWTEIADLVEKEASHRQKVLCVRLKNPDRFKSTNLLGRLAGLNRALGFGDIAINAAGTDKTFAELKEAAFSHWLSRR